MSYAQLQMGADLLLQLLDLPLLHLVLQLNARFAAVGLALSLSSSTRLQSLHPTNMQVCVATEQMSRMLNFKTQRVVLKSRSI